MPGVLHTPAAAVAVFEREPHWGPGLTWQFADGSVLVRPCSRLADVDACLCDWPRSLCVVEFDAAPAAVLNWFAQRIGKSSPPVLVFATPASAELEWTLREAGAVSFRPDLISGSELAAQCRRILRRSGCA